MQTKISYCELRYLRVPRFQMAAGHRDRDAGHDNGQGHGHGSESGGRRCGRLRFSAHWHWYWQAPAAASSVESLLVAVLSHESEYFQWPRPLAVPTELSGCLRVTSGNPTPVTSRGCFGISHRYPRAGPGVIPISISWLSHTYLC